MAKEKNEKRQRGQAVDESIDFSKIGKVVESTKIVRRKYTEGGKWKHETILEFLRWCEKNLPKDKAKVLSIEDVFKIFYKPNNESSESLKNNEKRMLSFVRTFVKTAGKIAKENEIKVHVGVKDKVHIKIQRIE